MRIKFGQTGLAPFDPSTPKPTLEPNMKWIGRPLAEIKPFEKSTIIFGLQETQIKPNNNRTNLADLGLVASYDIRPMPWKLIGSILHRSRCPQGGGGVHL